MAAACSAAWTTSSSVITSRGGTTRKTAAADAGKSINQDYSATPFATNYPLADANDAFVAWFEDQYRSRWTCENAIFKVYKHWLGRSPTQRIGRRCLGYGLALVVLSLWALFKRERQLKFDLPLHHPELALGTTVAEWLAALRLQNE